MDARREDLEAFLGDLLQRRAPEIVATRYRRLRVLHRWLEEEEEITASPMARMRPPIVPEQPVPVVPEDGLRQLLAACAGKDFEARRDTAIVMFLLDTGARRPSWPTSSSATLTWTWMSRSCSARAAASAPCPTAARRLSRWTAIYAFAPGTRTPISPWLWLGRSPWPHPPWSGMWPPGHPGMAAGFLRGAQPAVSRRGQRRSGGCRRRA